MVKNGKQREMIIKNLGTLISLCACFIAIAVQWGAITTTLDQFEKRLDSIGASIERQNEKIDGIEKDVSFIKGKMEK